MPLLLGESIAPSVLLARPSDSSAIKYTTIKGPISPPFKLAFLACEQILTLQPGPLYEPGQAM